MSIRRRSSSSTAARASGPHSPDTCALSLKWAFMLLLDLGGHRNYIRQHHFSCDEIALELGLQTLIDVDDFSQAKALRLLRDERRLFDLAFPAPDYPEQLAANLYTLGQLIGLDEVEMRLLGFCVLLHSDSLLGDVADQLGTIGFERTLRILASLLDIPLAALAPRLAREGRLVSSGLLDSEVAAGSLCSMSCRLSLESSDFLQQLRFGCGEPLELFRHAFRLSPPGHLRVQDYRHLGRSLEIAIGYLQQALAAGRSGVNILLYGPPGTGKTQLARLLAQLMKAPLYEVACTDNDGDPISPHKRLCSLRTAMCVLRSRQALLVLDEIEDIFASPVLLFGDSSKVQKGWINRMLEENPLPCLWLSNDVDCLDNAYIRRFDLVIELPNSPTSQRAQMIRECGGGRLGKALVGRLADHEQVTPAIIERAVRVGSSLNRRGGKGLDATVACLVNGTLKAQGFARLDSGNESSLPDLYSPSLINADIALDNLLGGLREHCEARLCFYGPPGTGKTAFGHWLARELERPLLVKRVSDLVSPFVGMTEKNLARAFEQASEDRAVLLLDEVDSFLQDRRKASQSWEITAVNEMLTQMESYRGLFIASTNLMRDLDEASLRRFDLKIHFGYLQPQQIEALFAAHLRVLGIEDPGLEAAQRLIGEACLTPGDFALIARRARFKPFADAGELAEALLAEVRLKAPTALRPIGFVH